MSADINQGAAAITLPVAAADRREALDQITSKIIGCVHEVSNTLGSGFLEKVYENALAVLNYLKATGLNVCLLVNFATPKAGVKRIVRNF